MGIYRSMCLPGSVKIRRIVLEIYLAEMNFFYLFRSYTDLDLGLPDPKFDRFMYLPRKPLVPTGVNIGSFVFKISCPQGFRITIPTVARPIPTEHSGAIGLNRGLCVRFATCQFAIWTFRYHLRRFATWTLLYLNGWLPRRFATWTFRTFGRFDTRTFRYLPERFTTRRQRLANVLTVSLSSSLSDRVDSKGPSRPPGVSTMSSLGPFSTNAQECTVCDLLYPRVAGTT